MNIPEPEKIDYIEVHLTELLLETAFNTASSQMKTRQLVFVKVSAGGTAGWGECSALNDIGYTNESASTCFKALSNVYAPWLVGRTLISSETFETLTAIEAAPMAIAAVEMALLDRELKLKNISLAAHLNSSNTQVKAGAVVSVGSESEINEQVETVIAAGFKRIKVKIRPEQDLSILKALTTQYPNIEWQTDANGSFKTQDFQTIANLSELAISVFEQPFSIDDTKSPQNLVEVLEKNGCGQHLLADESVTKVADANTLITSRQATAVTIKPAKLGGLNQAMALYQQCQSEQIPMSAGGMAESGLGRHCLASFASLQGFKIVGDISPARRWLKQDPWTDLEMRDGEIAVPNKPGIAPQMNLELLEQFTKHRTRIG